MADSTKTAIGMNQNISGALAYVLGIITGIVFIIIEKDNKFVRFHAMQSILLSVALIVISILASVFAFIPVLGWIVASLLGLLVSFGGIILWLFMMYKAYVGEMFKLPIIGDMAEKNI